MCHSVSPRLQLDNGVNLGSEEAYEEAVRREYG
jgi:hypothetical protein